MYRRRVAGLVLALVGLGGCAPPSTCEGVSTEVEDHSRIDGAEIWWPGVHHVTSTLVVARTYTLTLSPCVRVLLDADVGFAVAGSLYANGTPTQPVVFEPAFPGTRWGTVSVVPHGTVELSSTTLLRGGGSAPVETSSTLGAPLFAQGSGDVPPPMLKLSDVTIEEATGVGVALVNSAFDPASQNLTVHGAGSFAAYLGFDAIDSVPTGTYLGNGTDALALQTAYSQGHRNERPVTRSLTVHDRGVPYVVGMSTPGTLAIGSSLAPAGPTPTVTVEPGVTFAFTRGRLATGQLLIDGDVTATPTRALGALVVAGEPARPVVFTSAEATPAPGDWRGLVLVGLDDGTQLSHLELRYAGANSGLEGTCTTNSGPSPRDADAALQVFFERGAPGRAFLSDSAITDSAGSGLLRGWRGDDVDLLTGNSVARLAWCAQTPVPGKFAGCQGACTRAP